MAYTYKRKFRGQEVLFAGNRGHFTIRNSQLQRGTRPTVGISDALLKYIEKYNITLYISVLAPEVDFHTTAKQWYKSAKPEEQPSMYGIPWHIWRGPIPDEAFKKQEEQKVLVSMTSEERERYEYYKAHAM